ncbi:MAG: 4-alpha-glucanotransferase, partial [Erysipelotrichaceae bacterium]|nr:4-alpha-glucanotransferase [Erysipelotrichaceae bacterium]
MRASGILMPVSSLASKYGIGCFSKEAYEFIDFLKESGQTYWQILPFGPTGYGDSPYQCVSAFAGNPYFIDLETLKEEGLVEQWFLDERYFGTNPEYVDYGAQYNNRFLVLKMAFDAFRERGLQNSPEYQTFFKKEAYWLEDYALFMSIKRKMDQKSWQQWDLPLRTRDSVAIHVIKEELKELIEFFYFQQFEFYKQWNKLHAYAKKQGIKIIGDMPFYLAMDSVDAWSHPELFLFDKKGEPEYVAGCGPDAFSATGQLWGNPIYNW